MLSDAESREEQDGSEQKFVGGMMAKLWPIFVKVQQKTQKRNENEMLK